LLNLWSLFYSIKLTTQIVQLWLTIYILNEEITAQSTLQNSLSWLKINNYVAPRKKYENYPLRKDLMWLKVAGYKSKKNTSVSVAVKPKIIVPEVIAITVYEKLKFEKARYNFYLNMMTMAALLNLVIMLAFFEFLTN
jgi:hypothetical protein